MEHLEGRESVLAALTVGERRFRLILIRDGLRDERIADVLTMAEHRGVPIKRVARAELDAVAHGATHGGIVALCTARPRMSAEALLERLDRLRVPPLLLLLEGIDDARNLGFVIRTAEALGAHALLVKKHLWDFDAVEVARPASGAYERLPLVRIDDTTLIRTLRKREIAVFGCVPAAKRIIDAVDLCGPTLLALGGEKRGLSGAIRALCDAFVTIPTLGGASSLSLSHASAIVLAEAARQRRGPSEPADARSTT